MTKKAYFFDNGGSYSDWSFYGVIIVDTDEVNKEIMKECNKMAYKIAKEMYDRYYAGTDEYRAEHGYPNPLDAIEEVMTARGFHFEAYTPDEYISMT